LGETLRTILLFDHHSKERNAVMNKLKFAAISVVAILTLIVVLQNTESVETDILFTTITMPRAALLFGTLLIGFALGVLTMLWTSHRRKKQ
jgi:uncharacterized integral membrane protein